MYDYPHYKEQDREKIIDFMKEFPFVTLIGSDKSGRPAVTQIPVLVEEKEGKIFITGHMAKKSDHHFAMEENPQVMALFTGPHIYVSGTWYIGNLQQASTWNYISIQARGSIKFLGDDALIDVLRKLSLYYENGNTSSTTIYDNLPAEYVSKLSKAILAFELEVTELENVFKLSQNRDEKSYRNIIGKLEEQGPDGMYIAKKMKENTSKLFEKK